MNLALPLTLSAAFALGLALPRQDPAPPAFASFALEELVEQAREKETAWLSFLDRPSLEVGLYRLAAGATDGQRPHGQDEVYYVAAGKARFRAGEEEVAVGPGSVLFVAAELEHRFFEIEEELELVVFFSKAPTKQIGPTAEDDDG